jgi:hypothetical protein
MRYRSVLSRGMVFTLLVGCSSSDSSVGGEEPYEVARATTCAALNLPVPFASIATPTDAPRVVPGGYRLSATRFSSSSCPMQAARVGLGVDAELPSTSAGPMILRRAGGRRSVIVTRSGATGERAQVQGDLLVYPNVARDVDAIVYQSGDKIEELLLFHRSDAEAVYAFDLPGGSRLRVSRGKLLEILDEHGSAWLRARFGRAWDGHGSPVDIRVESEGTRVHVSLVGSPALPVLVDPTWEDTATMVDARALHTATKLKSGRVLLAGGRGSAFQALDSAEIFDPQTKSFTSVPSPMTQARHSHTASLPPPSAASQKVFLAGGLGPKSGICDECRLRSTELYDEDLASFSAGPDMHNGRASHTATLTSNQLVIIGGFAGNGVGKSSVIESYDWETGNLANVPTPCEPRYLHTAEKLMDGRILLAGGFAGVNGGVVTRAAEIFEPTLGECHQASPMQVSRAAHASALLLPRGDVVVTGGVSNEDGAQFAERFDVEKRTFVRVDVMQPSRSWHSSTRLSNGWVLVVGGNAQSSQSTTAAALLDPAAEKSEWTASAPVALPTGQHAATLLDSGDVLVTGGENGAAGPSDIAALFVAPRSNGSGCVSGAECASGQCVEGTCCSATCKRDEPFTCGYTGACDATGACIPSPARTPCVGNFVCPGEGAPCPTHCSSAVDCIPGFRCTAQGSCEAAEEPPSSCSYRRGLGAMRAWRTPFLVLSMAAYLLLRRTRARQVRIDNRGRGSGAKR